MFLIFKESLGKPVTSVPQRKQHGRIQYTNYLSNVPCSTTGECIILRSHSPRTPNETASQMYTVLVYSCITVPNVYIDNCVSAVNKI